MAYLVHDENLADIQDKAQARANLGVYSTTQTDDAIAAAAVSVADAALLKAANLNDVADVAQARTNLGVYSTTQTDGAIAAAAGSVADAALQKAANLGDVADVAQARTNLGVYSTAQTDDAIAAASGSVAGAALQKAANLSDVVDVAQARTNLGVYSTAQADAATTAALAALESSSGFMDRIAVLEHNLALTVLRDQISFGRSGLKMVNGLVDEFEDIAGIASSDGTYDTSGNYIHNPGAELQYTPTGSAFGDLTSGTGAGLAAAFDGNTWQTETASARITGTTTGYIGKSFSTAQAITKVRLYSTSDYGFTGGSAVPWTATVYGKSSAPANGTDGTVLGMLSWTTSTGYEVQDITCSGASYQYVWVYFDHPAGSFTEVAELQYFIEQGSTDITVVSVTADAKPGSSDAEARLILLHQPVDTVTLKTDVTIEASRDGGTSWTAGSLVDVGAFDAATNILSAIVDLSGQPTGTAMKWRFKTFNAKRQRLHGLWMQWR